LSNVERRNKPFAQPNFEKIPCEATLLGSLIEAVMFTSNLAGRIKIILKRVCHF